MLLKLFCIFSPICQSILCVFCRFESKICFKTIVFGNALSCTIGLVLLLGGKTTNKWCNNQICCNRMNKT